MVACFSVGNCIHTLYRYSIEETVYNLFYLLKCTTRSECCTMVQSCYSRNWNQFLSKSWFKFLCYSCERLSMYYMIKLFMLDRSCGWSLWVSLFEVKKKKKKVTIAPSRLFLHSTWLCVAYGSSWKTTFQVSQGLKKGVRHTHPYPQYSQINLPQLYW